MDSKLIFAGFAAVLLVVAIVPYIRDTLTGKVRPHLYTWIVWTATGLISTASYFHGNGGYTVFTSAMGTFLCLIVVLLALRYGTRDITVSDTLALLVCAGAVFVWVGLENPLLAVILGISIDIVGYWPTLRKTYVAPWSEPVSSWAVWTLIPLFSVAALSSYNIFTLIVPLPILTVNAAFLAMMFIRRRTVPKPV